MKMIIIGLVVGLGIGGGVFFFLQGKKSPEKTEVAESASAEAEAEGAEGTTQSGSNANEAEGTGGSGGIYDLEPFIVNLADTSKIRYLKITVKLELINSKYADDLNQRLPQIRDALLLLLSSKEFANIRTVEGKMELRDEILQRVNALFRNNKVRMAYFTDFVTQ